jgi:hypothetical protein
MPRKKAAIHNGGGLKSTTAKAAKAAKSLFENIKRIGRRTGAVHPE